MQLTNEKLLVIAPHPDDETLGCHGLIEHVRSGGGAVYVQVMTVGGYQRSDDEQVTNTEWQLEFQRATERMELAGTDVMLSNEDFQSLDTLPLTRIIQYIEHGSPISLREIQPTIIAIPTMYSTHQDHIISYKAAITALRTNPVQGRRPPSMILAYEAPEYNLWSPYVELGNFSPNLYLPLSAAQVDSKCETLGLYHTQLKEGHRGIKSVRIQAEMRGHQAGVEFAEAFSIQKAIL